MVLRVEGDRLFVEVTEGDLANKVGAKAGTAVVARYIPIVRMSMLYGTVKNIGWPGKVMTEVDSLLLRGFASLVEKKQSKEDASSKQPPHVPVRRRTVDKGSATQYAFIVHHSYDTDICGRVSVRKGDVFVVKRDVDEHWVEGACIDGRRGLLPAYVLNEDMPTFKTASSSASVAAADDAAAAKEKVNTAGAADNDSYVAPAPAIVERDFHAQTDEDMSVAVGDALVILGVYDDDDEHVYAQAVDGTRRGRVPVSCLPLDDGTVDHRIVYARDACYPDFDTDLAFAAGDAISVVDAIDGIYFCGKLRGAVGLVTWAAVQDDPLPQKLKLSLAPPTQPRPNVRQSPTPSPRPSPRPSPMSSPQPPPRPPPPRPSPPRASPVLPSRPRPPASRYQ